MIGADDRAVVVLVYPGSRTASNAIGVLHSARPYYHVCSTYFEVVANTRHAIVMHA